MANLPIVTGTGLDHASSATASQARGGPLLTERDLRHVVARTVSVDDPLVPAKLPLGDDVIDAGTRYYWRATDAAEDGAQAEFVNPGPVGASSGFRLGVTGDWRGEPSPYPAIANADERGLDLFVKLDHTIYADYPSPFMPAEQATTLGEYRLKRLKVYSERAGLDVWNDLQKAAAILSAIDDHEVTNDLAGGAPAQAGEEGLYGAAAPTLVNDSPLYETGLRAFHEFNAIEERRYGDTGEARTGGRPAGRHAGAGPLHRDEQLLRAGQQPLSGCAPRSGVTRHVLHGSLHPARLVRDAGRAQPHLHAAKGADELQVAEVAEVADSEHFVLQRPEAVAQAHVVPLQDRGAERVGAVPFRHPHRRQAG